MEKRRNHPVKHIILAIAIALLSVFFFAYAVQAIYPGPKYDDFCDEDLYRVSADSQVDCEAVGGRWTDYEKDSLNMEISGWCDKDFACRNEYNDVREAYERTVFFANLIIGVIVLVGAFFLALEAVSAGLMGGAVMLIFYGTIRYWGNLSDIWRTVVLGLSLVVLITLAYKKLKD